MNVTNAIKTFTNSEFGQIRVVMLNNEPWFVAADVCRVLDLNNPTMTLERLRSNEKNTLSLTEGIRGNPNVNIVNEQGFYRLVFKSRKPDAARFQDWVFYEVLPSIRKYGLYAMDDLLNNPDLLIEAGQKLKAEREKRMIAEAKVAELQPKANYCDLILNCKEAVATTVIAKDYGMRAAEFNKLLKSLGIQGHPYKNSPWILKKPHDDKGYTVTITSTYEDSEGRTHTSKPYTKWTQKGRFFLYNFLKNRGILPVIELDRRNNVMNITA